MLQPSRDLKVVIAPPEGGYDEERLLKALALLISEKDFIDYLDGLYTDRKPDSRPDSARSGAPGEPGP